MLTPGPKLPVNPSYPFPVPVVVYTQGSEPESAWWLSGRLQEGYALHLAATTSSRFKGRTWKLVREKYRLRCLSYKSFILLSAVQELSGVSDPVLTLGINDLYSDALVMLSQGWEPDNVDALKAYKRLYSRV